MKWSSLLIVLLLTNCVSVSNYNKKLEKPLTPKQLKKDVRFVQKKINRLHPKSDLFLSKEDLKQSFDSLVQNLASPIKVNELYFALAPTIAKVKQGHMSLGLRLPKTHKKDQKRWSKMGMGPLSQIPMVFWKNGLYLRKNLTNDSTLIVGSRVLKINELHLDSLYQKYTKTFSTDGYNTTYYPYKFVRNFNSIYQLEIGLKDTLQVTFSYGDSTYIKTIIRKEKEVATTKKIDTVSAKAKEKSVVKQVDRKQLKLIKKQKRLFHYNKKTNQYTYNYKLIGKDSNIAYLRIKSFSTGKYKNIYKHVFSDIEGKNIEHLVLDLRGNLGGLLNNIHGLYSYLSTEPVKMIDTPVVTSKTSMVTPYFNTIPQYTYPLAAPIYPFFYSYQTLHTKKQNQEYTYSLASSKDKKPLNPIFKGKLYVIVDGSSFSAASLLAGRIQADGRGLIFGEETGGAHNSTVAGFMNKYQLPNSKLPFRLGIMHLVSAHPRGEFGRGVLPDVAVDYQLQELLENIDIPLNKVLIEIENNQETSKIQN